MIERRALASRIPGSERVWLVAMLASATIMVASACSSACGGGSTPKPAQHVDVLKYAAESDACVDNATTREESRACRAAVRAKHGLPPRDPVGP